MSEPFVLVGAPIFDGESVHHDHWLQISDGVIVGFDEMKNRPTGCRLVEVSDGLLVPGLSMGYHRQHEVAPSGSPLRPVLST